MRKMRKILLGLGTIAMIGSPIIAVVSCSDDPTLTDFSYTYDGKAYADLESFGHDVFRPGTETEGKEVGIVHSGKTYKKALTKEEVANLKGLIDDNNGQKNAYNLMLELAKFVELPPNIMSAFEAALKATFKSDGKHGNPPSGPGPGPTENSYTYKYGKDDATAISYPTTHDFGHAVFKDGALAEGEYIAIINGTNIYNEIITPEENTILTDMQAKGAKNAYNIMLEIASFVELPNADIAGYSKQLNEDLAGDGTPHMPSISDFEFIYNNITYSDKSTTAHAVSEFGHAIRGKSIELEVDQPLAISHEKAGGSKYEIAKLTQVNIDALLALQGEKTAFKYMEKIAEILGMVGSIQKTFHTYLTMAFNTPF